MPRVPDLHALIGMVFIGSVRWCAALTLVAVTACDGGAESGSPASNAGVGGQPLGGGPAGGSAGAPGGSSAGGAGATTGGSAGVANGGTVSGAAGAAGNGGAAGTAGGGAGSGGGGGPNDAAADVEALKPLDGFQILDPCDLTNYAVSPDPGAVCPQKDGVKNQHVTVKLAGEASLTYVVSLRVRGVVERYWYEGGSLDETSKVFYVGGVPTVGGFASACKNQASSLPFALPAAMAPEDGCFNGFNVYGMRVSAPEQHYFLNYTADKDNDRPPHAVYAQDYTVTIEAKGQAVLDFYVIGSDEHQCYNHTHVLDGVQLPMSPYIGQFLQFDVVGVQRKAP